jgi:hypothetical protein
VRKKDSATARAFAGLPHIGEWKRLTAADVAKIYRVSVSYLSTLHRLPPHVQQDVQDGRVKLSDIVNKRACQRDVADKVDKIIAEVGIDRVFAALDRATKPTNGNGHHTD